MFYRHLAVGLTAALAVFAVACGGSSSGSSSSSAPTSAPQAATGSVTVKVASSASLGSILTDGDGRTLYMRTNDASNKSSCNADCAQNWPPLLATGNLTAGVGVDAKQLSTIKRDDGSMEVALAGQPLYYFAFDKKPGDTTGQGVNAFGGIWYALGANGSAVKGAAPSSTPSSSGTPDYNY
jgi:predicted lipoprotein with Yx(FWY)xxD motif